MRPVYTDAQANLLIFDHREAILGVMPLLAKVAAACGRPGEIPSLPRLLEGAALGGRTPVLVLHLHPERGSMRSLAAEDVESAVLLHEYRVLGRRTRVFATDDGTGFHGVLAPEGQRVRAATLTTQALLARGARLVLSTLEGREEPEPLDGLVAAGAARVGLRRRPYGSGSRRTPTPYYGDTPHTLPSALYTGSITDILVQRRGALTALLCKAAPLFIKKRSATGPATDLAEVIRDPRTSWRSKPRRAKPLSGMEAVLGRRSAPSGVA